MNLGLTEQEIVALALSMKVGLVATLVSVPVAVLIALVLSRMRFFGRALLSGLVHLPLVLPPVVTGYLLLIAFGRRGPIGVALASCCGWSLSFHWTGAALAAGLMGFPLVVRSIRLSMEAVDPKLETAAATLGAAPVWVFLTVTLPLAAPGILAGAVLGFARALGEFGATITFVGNIPGETQTLASAIYAFSQTPGGDGPAWRLTLIAIALAIAALAASEALAGRLIPRQRS